MVLNNNNNNNNSQEPTLGQGLSRAGGYLGGFYAGYKIPQAIRNKFIYNPILRSANNDGFQGINYAFKGKIPARVSYGDDIFNAIKGESPFLEKLSGKKINRLASLGRIVTPVATGIGGAVLGNKLYNNYRNGKSSKLSE